MSAFQTAQSPALHSPARAKAFDPFFGWMHDGGVTVGPRVARKTSEIKNQMISFAVRAFLEESKEGVLPLVVVEPPSKATHEDFPFSGLISGKRGWANSDASAIIACPDGSVVTSIGLATPGMASRGLYETQIRAVLPSGAVGAVLVPWGSYGQPTITAAAERDGDRYKPSSYTPRVLVVKTNATAFEVSIRAEPTERKRMWGSRSCLVGLASLQLHGSSPPTVERFQGETAATLSFRELAPLNYAALDSYIHYDRTFGVPQAPLKVGDRVRARKRFNHQDLPGGGPAPDIESGTIGHVHAIDEDGDYDVRWEPDGRAHWSYASAPELMLEPEEEEEDGSFHVCEHEPDNDGLKQLIAIRSLGLARKASAPSNPLVEVVNSIGVMRTVFSFWSLKHWTALPYDVFGTTSSSRSSRTLIAEERSYRVWSAGVSLSGKVDSFLVKIRECEGGEKPVVRRFALATHKSACHKTMNIANTLIKIEAMNDDGVTIEDEVVAWSNHSFPVDYQFCDVTSYPPSLVDVTTSATTFKISVKHDNTCTCYSCSGGDGREYWPDSDDEPCTDSFCEAGLVIFRPLGYGDKAPPPPSWTPGKYRYQKTNIPYEWFSIGYDGAPRCWPKNEQGYTEK